MKCLITFEVKSNFNYLSFYTSIIVEHRCYVMDGMAKIMIVDRGPYQKDNPKRKLVNVPPTNEMCEGQAIMGDKHKGIESITLSAGDAIILLSGTEN